MSDGVLVSERSSEKSSAAKMSPDRYGEALHISPKFESDFADSMSASNWTGRVDDDECLSGKVCRITSVTK